MKRKKHLITLTNHTVIPHNYVGISNHTLPIQQADIFTVKQQFAAGVLERGLDQFSQIATDIVVTVLFGINGFLKEFIIVIMMNYNDNDETIKSDLKTKTLPILISLFDDSIIEIEQDKEIGHKSNIVTWDPILTKSIEQKKQYALLGHDVKCNYF